MIRVYVLCEGPTEERFVQRILAPHLLQHHVILNPISLDGGFNYERLKFNIVKLLNDDQDAYVTTLIDLYGLKGNYTGDTNNPNQTVFDRVQGMEHGLKQNILVHKNLQNDKFIPYFQVHEFEALLFSDSDTLQISLSLDRVLRPGCFEQIKVQFESPEHINDHPRTAPSKRIMAIAPYYNKVVDGTTILELIGLRKIRQECRHFDRWITQLEQLGTVNT